MRARPIRLEAGRYDIRAMAVGGGWKATAHLRRARQGAGVIASATADTEDAVVSAIRAMLQARDVGLAAQRREEVRMGFTVPAPGEFQDALAVVVLSPAQRAMLTAHAASGEAGLTATGLARAAGYAGYEGANMHYGKLGRALADLMNVAPPQSLIRGQDLWTGVLAVWVPGPRDDDGAGRWVMYPELRQALSGAAL